MKLVSWNVNGLRAIERKQADQWLWQQGFDVIALQETKSNSEQLSEYLLNQPGYYSCFESSTIRKGYSGVAFYTKFKPDEVIKGIGIEKFDSQGRLISIITGNTLICNGYFPNGGSKTASLEYKLEFYQAFLNFINNWRSNGYEIIWGGDLNVAHTAIDLARPEQNKNNTGFLPVERAWVDEVIGSGFVDVFRYFNPTATDVYTYWDLKSRARDRNVGWRIDYWLVSETLTDRLIDFKVHDEVIGSDHCPIELRVSI